MLGFPIEKSYTFSLPTIAALFLPYSKSSLIAERTLPSWYMLSFTTIFLSPYL